MTRITEFLLGFETDREGLDSPVTVGTTSSRLVPQNPNRLFLTFINPSTNTVYVDTQTSVAVDEGFIIARTTASFSSRPGRTATSRLKSSMLSLTAGRLTL